jgi:hypothetical protein
MDFNYKPPPTGAKFLNSSKFIKVIGGPIGSGKSTVALMDLFKRAVQQKPFMGVRRTRFGLMRNTLQQLKSTVKPLIDHWFVTLPAGKWGQWRLTDNVFEMRVDMPDGTKVHSEFWLLPADTPDDVRRLLSLELSAGWCEEWREINPEVFSGFQGRVARYPNMASGGVTYPGVICSTNPPPIGTWHQQLMDAPPDNMDVFFQPPALLEDGSINPEAENLENLDPDYYTNLVAGKTDDWIDVYLRNKFGAGGFGQPVFKSTFKMKFHVAKEPLKPIPAANNPILVGMDNGLTAAAVIGQMDARGRVNVLQEAYVPDGQTMGVETFMDRLLVPKLLAMKVPVSSVRFVLDPACWARSQVNEVTIAMAVASRGFAPMRASTNDPERRIAAVEGLLVRAIDGGPGLLISPECPWLIQALDWGYRNKKLSSGQQTATPEKSHHSHIADALQYFALHYNLQVNPSADGLKTKAKVVQQRAYAYV